MDEENVSPQKTPPIPVRGETEDTGEKKTSLSSKTVGLGLRLGVEFISGILVGLGVGYFIDQTFQSAPWGMVVFIFLGGAAGMLNVIRLVQQQNRDKGKQ